MRCARESRRSSTDSSTIPAGEMVVVSLPSANRDADFLKDADVFDVTRKPGAHLAFDDGIHQCLGQQLARMELSVAHPAMLTKLPNLRVAAQESELVFRSNGPVNGLRAPPITRDRAMVLARGGIACESRVQVLVVQFTVPVPV